MQHDYKKEIEQTTKILDAWLPWKIQYDHIPGLAVGIVYKNNLIYKKGFGYANIKLKTRMTPETCFRIASISKTFTAVAIMQLVEQNKINLDDKVEKYLPWFKVKNGKLTSSNITIRQLLSHTAGVFRDGVTPHWENDIFPDIKLLKQSVSSKSLVYENLTKFKYSNFGYALLGEVIKEVSGLEYNAYVTKNIINEIGMNHSFPDYAKNT